MSAFKVFSILSNIAILMSVLLTLSACGSTSPAAILPLAGDRPTFIYFFSNN